MSDSHIKQNNKQALVRGKRRKMISIRDICDASHNTRIVYHYDGNIRTVSSLVDADSESLSYCVQEDDTALVKIKKSKSRVIICSDKLRISENDFRDKTLILSSNPKLTLGRVIKEFFPEERKVGIDASAIINKDAKIHPDVFIGPNTYIGKCQIGKGTVIFGNVYMYSNVNIGERVVIHAGTVIGAPGMEFARDESGQMVDVPHISGVVIGDDVWIGSNASIMGGLFRDTVIGKGTKIGPFSSIGHQVVIGENCLIITRSVIGGSCHIGNNSRISLASCIREGISIGNNVIIGMGSLVLKNIGDGIVAYGTPAKEIRKTK